MSAPKPVRFLDRTTPPHIVTLVLLTGISAMNMSVFLPSLPAMTAYFGTDYAVMQLSVSLYLAATALVQIVVGPISDRFGRRPVTLWALAVFLAATAGCLFAPNVQVFLACRMLQSAVATGLVLGRAVVRDMYPQDQAASMLGYVTMGMAMVPMVAPSIGGALQEMIGWQAIFVLLLSAGATTFWLAFSDMGETSAGGGLSFRRQLHDYPELLTSHRFWGYSLAAAFSAGAFFAFLGGAPYAADQIFGLSPFWIGVSFGAPAIGYILGNYLSGRFSAHFGINPMILAGTGIATSGMAVSVLIGHLGFGGPLLFFSFVTTLGLGNGMVIPNASAGTLSVRPQLAGTASGLGGAIMIGGGAALSVLAGHVIEGSATALPLQWLMLLSSFASLICTIYVLRRERQLQRVG